MSGLKNKDLKRRILDISYKKKLSHIGSCLTAVDIIDEIYKTKKPDEKFVLSSGHAGLALYTVIEEYEGVDAEQIFDHHGVHPDRCFKCGLFCSTGSLGHGLGIAVGMALADRTKNVYCLISDGECAEGSIWEALRIANEQRLNNLKVYLNENGFGAYRRLYSVVPIWDDNDIWYDPIICHTTMDGWPEWLQGLNAHYVTMDKAKYKEALEVLK